MKKLEEIDRLVGEAITELNIYVRDCWRPILTTLARKCAEINTEGIIHNSIPVNNFIVLYNSRIRDGQVEEVKQEEKPALQPLPDEVPEWFMDHFLRQSALEEWNKIRQHFGTQPREWWMDLKKGYKFVDYSGNTRVFYDFLLEYKNDLGGYSRACARQSSPYTDPTQSFRDKLTPEMQVEFDKVIETINNK